MMVSTMTPEANTAARAAIIIAARRNQVLRDAWFGAKRVLNEEMEIHYRRYEDMESDLLQEVLEKEIAISGCQESSVHINKHGWLNEFNPNDDIPF